MDKYDECIGCTIYGICLAQESKSHLKSIVIKECPCTICLIKIMCTDSCTEHTTWASRIAGARIIPKRNK